MPKSIGFVGVMLLLVGCGGSAGPELIRVNGTVTYQDAPIVDGAIGFIPTEGTEAPSRIAVIKDGKYEAANRGALAPGTYRIEIMAYEGGDGDAELPISNPDQPEPKSPKQVLPEKFNTKSEIEPFTVPSGSGPITQNYDLK